MGANQSLLPPGGIWKEEVAWEGPWEEPCDTDISMVKEAMEMDGLSNC